jgi:hypothetical protein
MSLPMRRLVLATPLLFGMATPVVLAASCSAEMPGPQVCDGRSPCDEGRTCVLGRCRKKATMPVSADATRVEYPPVDVAWLGGDDAQSLGSLGDKIVLGKRGAAETLVLRFAVKLPPEKKLQKALLRLEPLARCERAPGRIALELADVIAPWSSAQLARGRRPKLGIPMRIADTSATPARPLLLDVTELVRRWQQHEGRFHGVALLAHGNSASGACFSSGVSDAVGPRLQVFFWPPADAGSDASDGGDAEGGQDAGADASPKSEDEP